jgi:predicted transglutaminase-like cysteine proteinase
LKRPAPALALLLAAAFSLLAPFAARETGWLKIPGSAAGMGAGPAQSPANFVQNDTAAPTNPAENSGGNASRALNNTDDAEDRPLQDATTNVGLKPDHAPPGDAHGERPVRTEQEGPEKIRQESEPRRETGRISVPRPWRPSETTAEEPQTAATPEVRPEPERAEPDRLTRQGSAAKTQRVRIFRTVAFRGNFNALPKWKRVLSKAEAQVREFNACTPGKGCPPGATSWQRIISQARGLEPMEQLKAVNAFFNKWPYRLDQDVYGRSDWWATPQEFLKLSGDCEDYAITKYYALRELGYAPEDLRIVVLQDRIRGIPHAVLAVFLDGDAYVLDNVTSVVFSHSKYSHYVPYYSLNEKYRWSHIPVDKKP